MKRKIAVMLFISCVVIGLLSGCGSKESNTGTKDTGVTNNSSAEDQEGKYEVKVQDKSFYFPCKMQTILNAGYAMKEGDETKILSSEKEYDYVEVAGNDDAKFGIYIKADGTDIRNATALGVILKSYAEEQYYFSGLELGKATATEVLKELGTPETPDEFDETDSILTFTYEDNRLIIQIQDGVLGSVYYREELK